MERIKQKVVNLVIVLFAILYAQTAQSEVLLDWGVEDLVVGTLNNGSGSPFFDVNKYDGILVDTVDSLSHTGTKSIRLTYPVNEAGVELQINYFQATPSLYTRKYEYFAPGWEHNWPVGLKTSRYFSGDGSLSSAYHSEKMIWLTYDSDCNELYGTGMMSAIGDMDLEHMYQETEIFGNGLPYIRTGHWYKIETWMVVNSGDGVADGILQIWVDDVPVYDNTSVPWVDSIRGRSQGLDGWTRMWFGGNYSGAICGEPDTTLYRYIDDLYLSTTLDRNDSTPSRPAIVQGFKRL